ncbi:histone deacetylase superfamily protein [Calothrix sp. NIES-2100]|uniref:histone deacetylase family protein n=1 Tax=Calothrix sp. NIES-2100 TaxID=1954172 RepID=UPI000B5E587F|nr:histone deacetylase superfamily protein [Calothrix sp. NIES-2100]
MRTVLSPYFDAPGPARFLRRGNFVEHPDVAQRGSKILAGLEQAGCEIISVLPCELDLHPYILAVHDKAYVKYLENAWSNWSQMPDASTEIVPNIFPHRQIAQFNDNPVAMAGWYIADCAAPIGEYTWRNALGSVSAVIAGVTCLREGDAAIYTLCRPSGHHASQDKAMGMCFLNNAAIAAQELRKQFSKVAILDIDMHHGNGTQQIFYQRRDVFTISIHGHPANFYPFYTGFDSERGAGAGEKYNLNIPLPPGTNEAAYIPALEQAIEVISNFKAEASIVATGFDTFKSDSLGCFALESTSYNEIGRKIKSLQLPTLFVQEGGYYVAALDENVRQLVTGFENA